MSANMMEFVDRRICNRDHRRPKSLEIFAAKAAKTLKLGKASCDALCRKSLDVSDFGVTLVVIDSNQNHKCPQRPLTWGPMESRDSEIISIHGQFAKKNSVEDDENNNLTGASFDSDSNQSFEQESPKRDLEFSGSIYKTIESDNTSLCMSPIECVVTETPIVTFEEVFKFDIHPNPTSPSFMGKDVGGKTFDVLNVSELNKQTEINSGSVLSHVGVRKTCKEFQSPKTDHAPPDVHNVLESILDKVIEKLSNTTIGLNKCEKIQDTDNSEMTKHQKGADYASTCADHRMEIVNRSVNLNYQHAEGVSLLQESGDDLSQNDLKDFQRDSEICENVTKSNHLSTLINEDGAKESNVHSDITISNNELTTNFPKEENNIEDVIVSTLNEVIVGKSQTTMLSSVIEVDEELTELAMHTNTASENVERVGCILPNQTSGAVLFDVASVIEPRRTFGELWLDEDALEECLLQVNETQHSPSDIVFVEYKTESDLEVPCNDACQNDFDNKQIGISETTLENSTNTSEESNTTIKNTSKCYVRETAKENIDLEKVDKEIKAVVNGMLEKVAYVPYLYKNETVLCFDQVPMEQQKLEECLYENNIFNSKDTTEIQLSKSIQCGIVQGGQDENILSNYPTSNTETENVLHENIEYVDIKYTSHSIPHHIKDENVNNNSNKDNGLHKNDVKNQNSNSTTASTMRQQKVDSSSDKLFKSMKSCFEHDEDFFTNSTKQSLTSVTKASVEPEVDESSKEEGPHFQIRPSFFRDIPPSPHLRHATFKLPILDGLMTPQDEDEIDKSDVFSEETDMLLERANMRRQDSFGPTVYAKMNQLQSVEFGDDMFGSTEEDSTPVHQEIVNDSNNTSVDGKLNNKPPPVDRSTKPIKRQVLEPFVVPAVANEEEFISSRTSSLPLFFPPPLPPKPVQLIMKETVIADNVNQPSHEKRVETVNRNSSMSRGSATSSETVVANEEDICRREAAKSTSSSDGSHEIASPRSVDVPRFRVLEKSLSESQDKCPEMLKYFRPFSHGSKHIKSLDNVTSQSTDISDSLGTNMPPEIRVSSSEGSLLDKDPTFRPHDLLQSSISTPASSLESSPAGSPELVRHRQHRQGGVYYVPLRDREQEVIKAAVLEKRAKDSCGWLRAAGFPQYASLYEDGRFPLDTDMVLKDHEFLMEEHIEPLRRRLAILNKCANMRLDKVTTDPDLHTDEDDDEEPCAISQYWHCDGSNRWSRNNAEDDIPVPNYQSSQKFHQSIDSLSSVSSAAINKKLSDVNSSYDSKSSGNKHKLKPSIFKRVGDDLKKFRTPSFRRQTKNETIRAKRDAKARAIVIGKPELQSGHEKLDQFRCIPIEDQNADVLMSLQQQHVNSRYTRPRKNSSQSLTSTSSSSAGGSSAASTPATRSRSFREKKGTHHRGRSVDAVLRDPTSPILMNNKQVLKSQAGIASTLRNQPTPSNSEEKVFYISKSHTPGTFPTIVAEVAETELHGSSEDGDAPLPLPKPHKRRPHKVKQRSVSDFVGTNRLTRPVSIYDNINEHGLHPAASAQDLLDILTPPSPTNSEVTDNASAPFPSDPFWSVDDIMKQTESLKQRVHTWEEENDRHMTARQHSVEYVSTQTSEESRTVSPSSGSNENLYESEEHLNSVEDSRVTHVSHLHWMEPKQHTLSVSFEPLQLHNLSVGQLMILSRLSVLKLTATLEKFTPTTNGTKSTNSSWTVPRFIRRIKVPVYKDRDVFGVPLLHNVQKYGHPIPYCILNAMAYLYNEAMDQVGLFRKSGVKSRIQKIRNMCEADPSLKNFDIEDVNAYDVADMVKQYFRDLPDHIMTAKLSETFIGIFLYVPTEVRLQSLHAAIMLLPDENREALRTLLCYLKSVADHSDENQMNESNLAVCFAPSLFYQPSTSYTLSTNSPKGRKASRHGAGLGIGKPDIKEMNENNASNLCLAFMIQHVNNLFTIPEDAMTQCRLSVMQQTQDVLATEIGYPMQEHDTSEFLRDYHSYVNRIVDQTVRDEQRLSHNKTSGWTQVSSEQGTEMSYKKMNDGNPLRLWRCKVEIEGVTPEQVLKRVKDERYLWDDDLLEGRVVERPDEKSECYYCVRAQMRPHPSRDYCVMRSWRSNVSNRTVMVETSTDHADVPPADGVRGVVLTSRYVIENVPSSQPSSNADYTSSNSSLSSSGAPSHKCYLTRLVRVDTKGRNPEWYNKAFGHIALKNLMKVRDSFRLMQNNNNFILPKLKENK